MLFIECLLAGLVFIFLGGLVYILGALMVWGFLLLGFLMVFWFYAALMFFWFSGVLFFLIFWCFLVIFWIFYDFFSGLLLYLYSPKWVQFLKFSCNSFFLEYTDGVDEVIPKCHRLRFEASSLVFNRICKSIKKYKRGGLFFQAVHVYRLHD